jgi:hypothetical protein
MFLTLIGKEGVTLVQFKMGDRMEPDVWVVCQAMGSCRIRHDSTPCEIGRMHHLAIAHLDPLVPGG